MHAVRKPPARVTAGVTAGLTALALALGGTGCSAGSAARHGQDGPAGPGAEADPQVPPPLRAIGDGSTADSGSQPRQPDPRRLRDGERPPQFVVFSWDGAVQDDRHLMSYVRDFGERDGAAMTYFVSGLSMLPADRRTLYTPPGHPSGSADVTLPDRDTVAATVQQMRLAWADGSEIGSYFGGHFCGQDGGAAEQQDAAGDAGEAGGVSGDWTADEWAGELQQAREFTQDWKTNTGLATLDPLPFAYPDAVVGARPPCLNDPAGLPAAARAEGLRYLADPTAQPQVWPAKADGLWHFATQEVPVPGRDVDTPATDQGFLTVQSGAPVPGASDPQQNAAWGEQMKEGLLAGFERAYAGNRAPLFVSSHLESWNGGVYLKAVEDTVHEVCGRPDVRCVTFKQLADWLDAQDPKVLGALRGLDVGQEPKGGWKDLLRAKPAPAPTE